MRSKLESAIIWAESNGMVAISPTEQKCYDHIASIIGSETGELPNHPCWYPVRGTASFLTYEDKGKTINTAVHTQSDTTTSLSPAKLSKFRIEAEIYGEARTNDWDIPLSADSDVNNTVAIRRSQGTVELMYRVNASWGQAHDFGVLPEDGTVLVLEFDNGHVRAGIPSLDLWYETDVNWTTAYPAIRTHTRDYAGLMAKNYKITGGTNNEKHTRKLTYYRSKHRVNVCSVLHNEQISYTDKCTKRYTNTIKRCGFRRSSRNI